MKYKSGDSTGATTTITTVNTSSNPIYQPIPEPYVLKRGIQEAQVSVQRYLMISIINIKLSLSSSQRATRMRQRRSLIIYHIRVRETYSLFSSTSLRIYNKEKQKQVNEIIFEWICDGLEYIIIQYRQAKSRS